MLKATFCDGKQIAYSTGLHMAAMKEDTWGLEMGPVLAYSEEAFLWPCICNVIFDPIWTTFGSPEPSVLCCITVPFLSSPAHRR
jgi:hypothetical protein